MMEIKNWFKNKNETVEDNKKLLEETDEQYKLRGILGRDNLYSEDSTLLHDKMSEDSEGESRAYLSEGESEKIALAMQKKIDDLAITINKLYDEARLQDKLNINTTERYSYEMGRITILNEQIARLKHKINTQKFSEDKLDQICGILVNKEMELENHKKHTSNTTIESDPESIDVIADALSEYRRELEVIYDIDKGDEVELEIEYLYKILKQKEVYYTKLKLTEEKQLENLSSNLDMLKEIDPESKQIKSIENQIADIRENSISKIKGRIFALENHSNN